MFARALKKIFTSVCVSPPRSALNLNIQADWNSRLSLPLSLPPPPAIRNASTHSVPSDKCLETETRAGPLSMLAISKQLEPAARNKRARLDGTNCRPISPRIVCQSGKNANSA